MNKELEEAIKNIKTRIQKIKENMEKGCYYGEQYFMQQEIKEIETLLAYIDNSTPTEIIKEEILKLWIKCPKNSTDEFMITERDYKIEALQGLLKNKHKEEV